MENETKQTHWLNVIDWFYILGVVVWLYIKDNPFPKKADYEQGAEPRIEPNASEDSTGNISTRDSEPHEPVN